jgi:hypothetical protein
MSAAFAECHMRAVVLAAKCLAMIVPSVEFLLFYLVRKCN